MIRLMMAAAIALGQLAGSSRTEEPSSVGVAGRIVGGAPSPIDEQPWLASVQTDSGWHLCGGSLVSESVVLTAAHCTAHSTAAQLRVRLASSLTQAGGRLHRVAHIVRHEGFREGYEGARNDLALLGLSEPVEPGGGARPIGLLGRGERLAPSERVSSAGWGALESEAVGRGQPGQLRSVELRVVDRDSCAADYGHRYSLEGQICAFSPYRGDCQGDSGGPLVAGGRQAGIVSWAKGCASNRYPGVYTEVAHYRDWIDLHVAALSGPPPPGQSSDYPVTFPIASLLRQPESTTNTPSFSAAYQPDFVFPADR